MEIWKDIKDFEGYYQISNLGRVKSIKRTAIIRLGGKRIVKEKLLKQETVRGGYKRVSLSMNSKAKRYSVHRLVAMHFIPNLLDKPDVNHIDKITDNNQIKNLEWVTRRENIVHQNKGSNKHYGISYVKRMKTYQISIFFKGKKNYLGSTRDINKALEIRNEFLINNNIKNKYVCI